MIKELQLENFLFMKNASLAFSPGLNVITGETGAGKSIMLEAVKLILGKKSRTGIVMPGETTAKIQAEFDIKSLKPLKNKLEETGLLNEDEPDLLSVSRTFKEEGSGRVFVNGIMSTASVLKELGPYLMEIHGQNEHQTLLDPDTQKHLLDRTGSETHKNNLIELKATHKKRQQIIRQLSELESKTSRSAERIEELESILKDVMSLNLSNENEEEELKEESKILSHSEQILSNLRAATSIFSDNEEESGAVTKLYKAFESLRKISDFDNSLTELSERTGSLYYELKALQTDLEYKADETDLNPDRLYEVQARLTDISRVCRKLGCDFKGLFELKQKVNTELEELMQPDQTKDKLRIALAEIDKQYKSLLSEITAEREMLAKSLNEKVSAEMALLGFNSSVFEAKAEKTEPTSDGAENIEFYVSLNPGAPGGPLRKIASGGELSRVALAIKKVLATCDALPTLIFDEIDTGIGGKTAEAVAESLNKLGKEKQVLLVTHLHQIAKEGTCHFMVSKSIKENQTRINIAQVEGQERVEEIARMLGQTDSDGLSFAQTLLSKSN
ncbi:MAG: DNA repair protein RecN [Candidatus Riflebacteria bacterium]|nr:DNA repair protein RecN [Candidatus Riflebacteria bacterium]MDD3000204.1 DNA repair protein RecN [Candidatus Riflebacteria bacterium]